MIARQGDDMQPEFLNRINDIDELAEIGRLNQIGIDAQVVATLDITVRAGGSKGNHRNMLEQIVILDLGQNLAPILARQIEIQKNDVGNRGLDELALTTEKKHRLHPVGNVVDAAGRFAVARNFQNQTGVAGIILDKQYLRWPESSSL